MINIMIHHVIFKFCLSCITKQIKTKRKLIPGSLQNVNIFVVCFNFLFNCKTQKIDRVSQKKSCFTFCLIFRIQNNILQFFFFSFANVQYIFFSKGEKNTKIIYLILNFGFRCKAYRRYIGSNSFRIRCACYLIC